MPIYTDFNEWLRNFKGVIPEPLKPIIHPNNVFITPIAKSYKPKNGPCSRRDWEEQIERNFAFVDEHVEDLMKCWKLVRRSAKS